MDETKIPLQLRNAVDSFFGSNGGSLENPIWLCALEWGGGYNYDEPLKPEDLQDESYYPNPITRETLQKFLFERGRVFFCSQFMLIHAIVAPIYREGIKVAACINDGFLFLCENNYGVSLNAYPISMKKHTFNFEAWDKDKVVIEQKAPHLTDKKTLKEWTGIDTFEEYLSWCTQVRANKFSKAREKYMPAIVYCGGIKDKQNFFKIWTNQNYREPDGRFKKEVAPSSVEYWWISNGKGRRETLLVVGPFFGGRFGLHNYKKSWKLGRELRRLCDERFKDNGAWLKEDLFMPNEFRGQY